MKLKILKRKIETLCNTSSNY